MVLLSYSNSDFVSQILSGEKSQTCRPYSERQLRIFMNNPTLHLWYKSRTPERLKIGEVKRNFLDLVTFQEDGFTYLKDSSYETDYLKEDDFAKLDGFENYSEMYCWFLKRYPEMNYLDYVPFICIRWDPDTLVPAAVTSPAKTTTQESEA